MSKPITTSIVLILTAIQTFICGCSEKQLDPHETDIPILIRFLEEGDTEERSRAAYLLKEIGPDAKEATPALIKALRGPEREVYWNSSDAIRFIGVDSIPYIFEALDDPDWEMRAAALDAARLFPKAFLKILPDLIELLEDDKYEIRIGAVGVIGLIGPEAADAVEPLTNLLASEADKSQAVVCYALANIGEAAEYAVPVLINQLQKDTVHTYGLTINALGEIGAGATEAIPYLIELLGDEMKPEFDSNDYPPQLDISEDEIPTTGDRAAAALGKIGPAAIPALLDELKSTNQNVRVRIISILGEYGLAAADVLPNLYELQETGSPAIRTAAGKAIQRIEYEITADEE